MKRRLTYLIGFVLILSLVSCTPSSSVTSSPSASPSGPRKLIIDGDTITSENFGGFTCWYCNDFIDGGKTLVEVGYFNEMKAIGFILFDGTYSGEKAVYRRDGFDHSWNWGDDADYKFVIKTDGTGAYFDFRGVPEGVSIKPRSIFKCKRR